MGALLFQIAYYAILDICAKVVFGFILLLGVESLEKKQSNTNTAATSKPVPTR